MNSIALGYQALNRISSSDDIRILEASPVGARFLILAMAIGAAGNETLRLGLERARAQADADFITDSELISGVDGRVIDSYFALSTATLNESLVVIETATVSGCLDVAQILAATHGLQPIEIRVNRNSNGGAFGFFTGTAQLCLAAALEVRARLKAKGRKGFVEVVEEPTKALRSYFELQG